MQTRSLAIALCALCALHACASQNDTTKTTTTTCPTGEVEDTATGTCVACPATGLLHAQTLEVGSAERYYMLYVPSSYECAGSAVSLLIDFHGTWSGSDADDGEEFYALPGLEAESEAFGFIVARPRSLSSVEDGLNVYRWDENPGDLTRNATFAHQLVTVLEGQYHVDESRVYASGFSSGTGMTAQFFADDPQVFHGYAFVGGGFWSTEPPASVQLDAAPRMYGVSGYRDYLYAEQQVLTSLLAQVQYPSDHFFQRTDTNGHELYGWHYRELFAWLDQNTRPGAGALGSAWQAEATPSSEDLTALASDGSGGLLAAGATGGIYRRDPVAGWSKLSTVPGAPALSGLCVLPTGQGVAVGEASAARTSDRGATWTSTAIPAFVPNYYDPPYMTAVGCSQSEIVAVGNWDAANGSDGATWAASDTSSFGYAVQDAQIKASAAGTWIASGYYDYIGRSTDGVTFASITLPVDVQWLMGIAPGPSGQWWVVGEAGTVIASSDDGMTWAAQTVPTTEDLYAVAFYDASRGVAVGAHGAAIVTTDGGQTWQDRATGIDAYLGDATWLDANTVLVVGGLGTAATLHVD